MRRTNQFFIILKYLLIRFFNQLNGCMSYKKNPVTGARVATPSKAKNLTPFFLLIIIPAMIFFSFLITHKYLTNYSHELKRMDRVRGKIVIPWLIYKDLQDNEQTKRTLEFKTTTPPNPYIINQKLITSPAWKSYSFAEKKKCILAGVTHYNKALISYNKSHEWSNSNFRRIRIKYRQSSAAIFDKLTKYPKWQNYSETEKFTRLVKLKKSYLKYGSKAFATDNIAFRRHSLSNTPPINPNQRPLLLHSMTLIILLIALMSLVFSLSMDKGLGQDNWSVEWLYSLPASSIHIFGTKLLTYTFTNIMAIIILPVIFFQIYKIVDLPAPILLASYMTIFCLIMLAAARLLIEISLKTLLRYSTQKNIHALLTILSMLLTLMLYFIFLSPTGAKYSINFSQYLGNFIYYQPFALPMLVCHPASNPEWLILLATPIAITIIYITLLLVKWLLRNGLIVNSGSYQGKRAPATVDKSPEEQYSSSCFNGIVGKELRLLWRDKQFFTQAIIVPLVVIGMQLVVNQKLLQNISTNFSYSAMLAFGIAAYSLGFTAIRVLAVEGSSLWLLFTVPSSIEKIMLRKTIMWASLTMIYPVLILSYGIYQAASIDLMLCFNSFIVIIGIFIYAFIGAGLGILGTDPLEQDRNNRVSFISTMIYLFLISCYIAAIFSPLIQTKIFILALCLALAYAIWQKVTDKVPYLLDPTAQPPSCLSLSTGLIAVIAFFTLQMLIVMLCSFTTTLPLGALVFIAFSIAGAAVMLISGLTFYLDKMPNLLITLGLKRQKSTSPFYIVMLETVLFGLLAILIGFGYLYLCEIFKPLQLLKEQVTNASTTAALGLWLVPLVVIAAPLCEEYIFRGILFAGLRRSLPLFTAIFISAAIFALIHPAISIVPVFCLGLITAYAYQRTKLLIVPIVIHSLYNFAIVLMVT